jgi:4-hydroxy-tetrahydrodipicolinate reductase
MAVTRIGIVGCAGRMGQMLVRVATATEGCLVAAGSERPGSPSIGKDIGALAGIEPLGIEVTDDPKALFGPCHVVLEFSSPAATVRHAALAAAAGTAHVIGTTGLDAAQSAAVEKAAKKIAIVWAPNMSQGVTLLTELVRRVAGSLGPNWDIEILEMHHRHKVDAPSGTALALGEAAASGRKTDLPSVAKRVRDGQVGARATGEIGFAVLRGGDVAGEHSVLFVGEGERIELSHKASNREIFARGAVRAALWARRQRPGLYRMKDVLGLTGW